jgi:hypothetical protein
VPLPTFPLSYPRRDADALALEALALESAAAAAVNVNAKDNGENFIVALQQQRKK